MVAYSYRLFTCPAADTGVVTVKRNYSKLISVTLILVVMLAVFAFPTPVYAGGQPPVAEQSAYAVFQNNSGAVGTQIGSDTSAVTVTTGQNIFVCIQMDFSTIMKDHDMIGQWQVWGTSNWQSMAVIGAGSSTDWEYWNSNYTDHTSNEVSDHFGDTAEGNYIFESDFVGYGTKYPTGGTGKHETWFVIQAPTTAAQYEIRWYDSEEPAAMTPTVQVDITVVGAPPTVSTQAASSIDDNSATLNGNITDTGDSNVTERGFDWGLTDSYGSSWTETPGPYGTGTYNHGISGLDSGTTYHFRAKAYNSNGWAYGADTEFTTTALPNLRVVQGNPWKGNATWWEWIVVNPTDSTITVTEVRVVDDAATDWGWTADNTQGYPTSGWTDGGVNGYYWSGSDPEGTVPAHSAKVFQSRPVQANATDSTSHTMTWSLTVTGYSPAQRQTQVW